MRILTLAFMLMIFGLYSCEDSSLIGSDDVTVINNVEITVTEKMYNTSSLTARGTIKNTGNSKINPAWYVEGDFYSNSTHSFKLGGDNTYFNYSLGAGETTGWELMFSSANYDESQYPNFSVSNLRAYYENEND